MEGMLKSSLSVHTHSTPGWQSSTWAEEWRPTRRGSCWGSPCCSPRSPRRWVWRRGGQSRAWVGCGECWSYRPGQSDSRDLVNKTEGLRSKRGCNDSFINISFALVRQVTAIENDLVERSVICYNSLRVLNWNVSHISTTKIFKQVKPRVLIPQTAVPWGHISKSDQVPKFSPLPERREPCEQAMLTLLPAVSSRCLALSPLLLVSLFCNKYQTTDGYISTTDPLRLELNPVYKAPGLSAEQRIIPASEVPRFGGDEALVRPSEAGAEQLDGVEGGVVTDVSTAGLHHQLIARGPGVVRTELRGAPRAPAAPCLRPQLCLEVQTL